jgi:hypothetical protein
MSMTRVCLGLAALPLLTGVALAAPTQLTDLQMDKIAAGADFYEADDSNTSISVVAVHERSPNTFTQTVSSSAHPLTVTTCVNLGPTCTAAAPGTGNNNIGGTVNPGGGSPYYLLINNYALSVGAAFR